MNKPVIEISHLTKKYQLGQRDSFHNLRESFTSVFSFKKPVKPTFLALDDISLSIKQGDRVGIIGRNGAGKSTLLKILSQITPPTSGKITMHGRVASLLEVGTGFHLELTGRENIFLNGAILGMTRREIAKNFDQIVAFSEIEQFLDTPVKRYSSGMFVRLAFSVAAHLQSEILIVDEVLAVGDREFQKKCLGKMEEIGKKGRTVLFVSHNMATIKELCTKAILLDHGKLIGMGQTDEIVQNYLETGDDHSRSAVDFNTYSSQRTTSRNTSFKFQSLKITTGKNKPSATIGIRDPFEIEVTGKLLKPTPDLYLSLTLNSALGFPICTLHASNHEDKIGKKSGNLSVKFVFDNNLLGPGLYTLGLNAEGTDVRDTIPNCLSFTVDHFSNRNNEALSSSFEGIILYPYKKEVII